jgi:hypothetical protein
VIREDVGPALRRLRDAEVLWHRCLEAYPDVDAFCREINGLLTTLRTVTWVLQKDCAGRKGFAEWYAKRQDAMRADPVMRWAVDARNQIEKQGDLEMRSKAKVSVLASWREPPVVEFEEDPLVPPAAIAAAVPGLKLPEIVREQGIVIVERRWVTISLPDDEILAACAHVYAVLDALLFDANSDTLSDHMTLPQVNETMSSGREARSAMLHLATGEWLKSHHTTIPASEADMPKVRERYGDVFDRLEGSDVETHVRSLHRAGRHVLTVDQWHMTLAVIFRDGAQIGVRAMEAADQAEKYVLMQQLVDEVKRTGGDEVVLSAETWTALAVPEDDPRAELRAGQREDRTEAFMTTGLDRAGRTLTLISPFARRGDEIVFDDPEELEEAPQMLLPIWRAWSPDPGAPPDPGVDSPSD